MAYTDEQIQDVVTASFSFKAAYTSLSGSMNSSSGYQHFRKRVERLNLDTSHFTTTGVDNHLAAMRKKRVPWQDILVYDRNGNGYRESSDKLRRALLQSGHEWKCADCGNDGWWNGEPMMLEIDHIDSNGLNNVEDNLRFLCPNCHSMYPHSESWGKIVQDENGLYTEREGSPNARVKYKCGLCGGPCSRKGANCKSCNTELQRNPLFTGPKCGSCNATVSKVGLDCTSCAGKKRQGNNWPSDEKLKKLLWEKSTVELAAELGVSDSAISKRCKVRGIEKPPRGYWAKVHAGKI